MTIALADINLTIISCLIAIISYLLGGFAITVIYIKYRYTGHLWFLFGFFFLLSSIFVRLTLETMSEDVAAQLWVIANTLLLLGLWLVVLSLIIGQYGKLPRITQVISLFFGFGTGINSRETVELVREGGSYSAIYQLSSANIILTVVVALLLFVLIRPLAIKIYRNKANFKDSNVLIILTAYLLLILWFGTALFNQDPIIRGLRLLFFALSISMWAIALFRNPMVIIITPDKIQKFIFVDNQSGMPLIAYDVYKETVIDMDIIASLMSAVKMGLETLVLGQTTNLRRMTFENSTINYISGKRITIVFLTSSGTSGSANLELLARIFLRQTEDHYKFSLQDAVLEVNDFKPISEELVNILQSSTL